MVGGSPDSAPETFVDAGHDARDNLLRQALADLGCDMGQGYLLGRPLEPSAMAALVLAQQGRGDLAKAG